MTSNATGIDSDIGYWVGIVGSVSRVAKPKQRDWWCVPEAAKSGDNIAMYCPRSASLRRHGFYAIYRLTTSPDPKNPKNTYCSGYSMNKGSLRCVEIELDRIFDKRITAAHCKLNPILKNAAFVRRNFQGTTFKIREVHLKEIISLSKKSEREN